MTDPDLIAGHLVEPRGLYKGRALALVRPASTQRRRDSSRYATNRRVPIMPQGGNTGLVGGQTPDSSGNEIILSLQRMNRVREVDASANVMIVEAGVTLANAQAAALEADRLFPLSLASEGTCTIGGNLSTNAGGVAVIAYGNARDLAMGLEVVLADGRVLNGLSKLRKDNTGYDLKNLFIGAEGTLGIITAAALKLFPNPRSVATAFVGLADPTHALQLLKIARQFVGAGVTSFELIPRIGLDFVLAHAKGSRDPLGSQPCLVRADRNLLADDDGRRGEHGLAAARRRSNRARSPTQASPRARNNASPSGNCANPCPKCRARRAARSSMT